MNYQETINLPKTLFPMKANLSNKEPEIQKQWEKLNLYERIRKLRQGRPKYILHDGPPYANGDVHVGTALNKILKDIVVRFKTMQGFDAPFIPGWDCHGLPIEHQVMTQLGERARRMSCTEIRQECEKYAYRFIQIQRKQFKSLGILGDWEQPYLTLQPAYEAAVIEVFADLVEKGYVYRRLKPIHWCISCETALAEAELVYAEVEGPSIYVKFPILDRESLQARSKVSLPYPCSWFIWTTTPWTLPGNVAVALNPEFIYALVEYHDPKSHQYEVLIFAEMLADKVMGLLGIKDYKIIGKVSGRVLEGLSYRHPFLERICSIILADYVHLLEGTGCVHIAPGHGEEDYESGLKYHLPVLSPVDAKGRFTSEAGILLGVNVFEADESICQLLDHLGVLLRRDQITHSYPHCWRCKKPVIFRATEQWFISVDHQAARQKALKAVQEVEWIPAWGKNRIASMLMSRPDWCISRQRNWGVPIPVFYCQTCREPLLDKKVIDQVKEIFLKEGAGVWWVKDPVELLPPETYCSKCAQNHFIKETDIFDVWFESGSSFRGVVIENKSLSFPADLYLEGTDQHRGWFQLSLLPALMTRGQAPFKKVLTHGFAITPEGEKISKSKGGLLLADEMVKEVGADIVRLWIASVNFTEDIPVSLKILRERRDPYRKIRNTFRYLLGNLYDFHPKADAVSYERLEEIDKWAISRLHNLIKTVTIAYEEFEFYKVYRQIYHFCEVEMSAFYLNILKDRLYTRAPLSLERRSAQTVLYEVLKNLTKLIAPILVHTAEEIWSYLPMREVESVHLADWPVANEQFISKHLETNWQKLALLKTEVERQLDKLRKNQLIGNSLEAEVILYTQSEELKSFLRQYEDILPEVLIVSSVHLAEAIPPSAVLAVDFPELFILVGKSHYQKCVRCWNYHPSVGQDKVHPSLCQRCLKTLSVCASSSC